MLNDDYCYVKSESFATWLLYNYSDSDIWLCKCRHLMRR